MSMERSFFNHALTNTSWEAPIDRGTLMPPVRGHDVKKDIPMLMRLTKDTSLALPKRPGGVFKELKWYKYF